MLKWEEIRTGHAESVFRAPVFGGWLVKIVLENGIAYSQNVPVSEMFGFQWTGSLTFVPDVEHKWLLESNYGPIKEENNMAFLILEAGDTCTIPDQMDAGPHAGETVTLISKNGDQWLVEGEDEKFFVKEKYLNLLRSV